jgi:hypothetical protein
MIFKSIIFHIYLSFMLYQLISAYQKFGLRQSRSLFHALGFRPRIPKRLSVRTLAVKRDDDNVIDAEIVGEYDEKEKKWKAYDERKSSSKNRNGTGGTAFGDSFSSYEGSSSRGSSESSASSTALSALGFAAKGIGSIISSGISKLKESFSSESVKSPPTPKQQFGSAIDKVCNTFGRTMFLLCKTPLCDAEIDESISHEYPCLDSHRLNCFI